MSAQWVKIDAHQVRLLQSFSTLKGERRLFKVPERERKKKRPQTNDWESE